MGRASRRKRERVTRALAPMGALWDAKRAKPHQPGLISGALLQLIEPYSDEAADSLETFQVLVALGAIAWNLALFPEAKRGLEIAESLRSLNPPDLDACCGLLATLAQRKRRLFPHDQRVIVKYEVLPIPDGYNVIVGAAGSDRAFPKP